MSIKLALIIYSPVIIVLYIMIWVGIHKQW